MSLTISVLKVVHLYPKPLYQAVHLNVEELSIGETGREESATLVTMLKNNDEYAPRTGYLDAILMFSKPTKTLRVLKT